MTRTDAACSRRLALLTVAVLLAAGACAPVRFPSRPPEEPVVVEPSPPSVKPPPSTRRPKPDKDPGRPIPPAPPVEPTPTPAPTVKKLPEIFESSDFVITFARAGDTARHLAERHLDDAGKAWMIEDYLGARSFSEGDEVVIPKRAWNPVGVFPWGYQLVPVLVYHDLGAEQVGRLKMSARTFEAQMRHLHAEGFRTVTIRDLLAFTEGRRQLPRKSVVIAFDDGYRSFLRYAHPVLKELGFTATLFVYTDYVGAGRNALSWADLRDLLQDGFDVQAHSKTHGKLRRREGESEAEYARRMEGELAHPLALFQKHLGRASETLAYPYGETDDELLRHVAQHGYVAGFTVRRQSNPAFVFPFKMNRSQIYAEMTPEEFARNLTVFQEEHLGAARSANATSAGPSDAALPRAMAPAPPAGARTVEGLAAFHNAQAEKLEHGGRLRQAREERLIARTISPRDRGTEEALKRLEARIAREVGELVQDGRALLGRGLMGEARQRFLAALALDPTNHVAFGALQNEVRDVTFIVHTVRAGDTLASLAELYYGDRFRAEVIAETNHLPLNARLAAGRTLRIPEIPGVPILR